jgi:hypothetical protein
VKSPLSMNFLIFSNSMCRGTLQKMGYYTPTHPPPLQELQALATCKGLKKNKKNKSPSFFKKRFKKGGGDLGQGPEPGPLRDLDPYRPWPRPGQGPAGLVAPPFWGAPNGGFPLGGRALHPCHMDCPIFLSI